MKTSCSASLVTSTRSYLHKPRNHICCPLSLRVWEWWYSVTQQQKLEAAISSLLLWHGWLGDTKGCKKYAALIHKDFLLEQLEDKNQGGHTILYDTRCYFNVRSKADISQLNLPHRNDNEKSVKTEKKLKSKKTDMLRSNSKQSGKST